MRVLNFLWVALVFTMAGCGSADDAGGGQQASAPAPQRGGTITVGETTWTIVPASCGAGADACCPPPASSADPQPAIVKTSAIHKKFSTRM